MKTESWSERLKILIKNKGLSTIDLAKKTGLSQPTISRLLSGATPDPRVYTLLPLANYFGITIDQLLGQEPMGPVEAENDYKSNAVSHIPILDWEQIEEWDRDNSFYVPKCRYYWVTTTIELSSRSYALILNSKSLPAPFIFNSFLIVDPKHSYEDGSYVVVYEQKSVPMIKKIIKDGSIKWLLSLNENISPTRLKENMIVSGTIVQISLSLMD